MRIIGYLAISAIYLLSGCMYPEKPRPLFPKHIGKSNIIMDSCPIGNPVDVVTDRQNKVYVLSSSQSKIYVFDSWLNLERTIDISATNPMGLTLDKDGRIYIADTGADRILRYTNEGELDTTFGSGGIVGQSGTGDAQFNSPWSIAVNFDERENEIYVSDSGNNSIQTFTLKGEFISRWKAREARKGEDKLDKPAGIHILSNGLLCVADKGNKRMLKFGESGYLSSLKKSWVFKEPTDICYHFSSGELIVADAKRNKLFMFYEYGLAFVKEVGGIGLKNPMGVACLNYISTENQILYVADTGNNRLLRLEVADYRIGSSPDDVFKKMKLALKNNNTEKALSYFHRDVRDSYRDAFKGKKGSKFEAFVNSSDKLIFNMDLGISKMYDFTGPDGYAYPIEFKKDIFGNWKIIRF